MTTSAARIERRGLRASMGALAVLSLADVVALLPGRESYWSAWVREHVAPVGPELDLYVWEDVVTALRSASGALAAARSPEPPKPAPKPRGKVTAIPRVSLG